MSNEPVGALRGGKSEEWWDGFDAGREHAMAVARMLASPTVGAVGAVIPPVGARVAASREEEMAVDWEQAARFLFDRLDDVDTAGDATYSAEEYRELVESIHRRRFEVAQTDGYTVTFNPVARPEPLREETGELEKPRAFNGDLGTTPISLLRESTATLNRAMEQNRDLERRLTGVENLAATAMRARDAAIERAEKAEAERDRLRTACDYLRSVVEQLHRDSHDAVGALAGVLAEARQSTPVSSEEG